MYINPQHEYVMYINPQHEYVMYINPRHEYVMYINPQHEYVMYINPRHEYVMYINPRHEYDCDVHQPAESPAETWADTEAAVRKTLATSLKLSERHVNDVRIERAHRTGGDNHSDKPKTVVVKFESYKDRDGTRVNKKDVWTFLGFQIFQTLRSNGVEFAVRTNTNICVNYY